MQDMIFHGAKSSDYLMILCPSHHVTQVQAETDKEFPAGLRNSTKWC